MRFRDFMFGWNSAEDEAKFNPDLLRSGFVDLNGESEALLNTHKFLVLGGKGTGKSAIAQHLKVSRQSDTFINIIELNQSMYNDLISVVRGDKSQLSKAWSWLLLLTLLSSYKEHGEQIESGGELAVFQNILESVGLFPADPKNIEELIRLSKRRSFREELPKAYRVGFNSVSSDQGRALATEEFHLGSFVSRLLGALCNFETRNRHIVVVDNTDKIRNPDRQLDQNSLLSLVELIEESFRLNEAFMLSGKRAKVIALCRTELFERLRAQKLSRIRDGYAVELNWYTHDPSNSPLIKLANLRASIQRGRDTDIFQTYFPSQVARNLYNSMGSPMKFKVLPAEPAPTAEFLLDRTRSTPRDFVQLLQEIQRFCPETKVSFGAIASGLRQYATRHFTTEITDELDGYLTTGEYESLMAAFGQMRSSRFKMDDLRRMLPEQYRDRLREMLSELFNCGLIGNWESSSNPSLRTYQFRFSRCRFNPEGKMMIHPALAVAVNAEPMPEEATLQELLRLGIGKTTIVAIPGQPGLIRSVDGWSFSYQNNDLAKRETLMVGDLVGFEPPERIMMQGRTKGALPYPPVRKVRRIPSHYYRFISDRLREFGEAEYGSPGDDRPKPDEARLP